MQRIKLLFIITKLELGGAQKQLLSLIGNLDKEQFSPYLFTANNGLLLQEASEIRGLFLKKSRFLDRALHPLKDLLALIEIFTFIRKHNFQIVHTHSSKAGILGRIGAKIGGVRHIIHTVHGWSFNDQQSRFIKRFNVILERIAGNFTERLTVVCLHDKEIGLKNGIAKEEKYCLIYYGINFPDFRCSSDSIKQRFGIGSNELVVSNISCFKPQKSPLDFVRLAHSIKPLFPNIKFLLIGDGSLRREIESLIFRLGLEKEVILTGWLKDIPALLSATDVLVLTSLWEGLPIVILEAFASGKPVIATDTKGVREIISERSNGFLVPLRDIEKMREKLIWLLKDRERRQALGENARRSLPDYFSLNNMVSKTEELYVDLLKKWEGQNAN